MPGWRAIRQNSCTVMAVLSPMQKRMQEVDAIEGYFSLSPLNAWPSKKNEKQNTNVKMMQPHKAALRFSARMLIKLRTM